VRRDQNHPCVLRLSQPTSEKQRHPANSSNIRSLRLVVTAFSSLHFLGKHLPLLHVTDRVYIISNMCTHYISQSFRQHMILPFTIVAPSDSHSNRTSLQPDWIWNLKSTCRPSILVSLQHATMLPIRCLTLITILLGLHHCSLKAANARRKGFCL
jgi:hypothetical protein